MPVYSKQNTGGYSGLASTRDGSSITQEQKYCYILNFKDFKGFKDVDNIKERYKIGKMLGSGSFG